MLVVVFSLSLLWSQVEVHSQTFPYASFIGQTLANHSYVKFSHIGYWLSGYKWKNHFFKMKGGYRDGLKHQKGRNKGSLHSKDAQSYMTPSLYLCLILNFASR